MDLFICFFFLDKRGSVPAFDSYQSPTMLHFRASLLIQNLFKTDPTRGWLEGNVLLSNYQKPNTQTLNFGD